MSAAFKIKKGDTGKVFRAKLLPTVDLTGATGATFKARLRGAVSNKISGAMTFYNYTPAIVDYEFTSSDLDTAGIYDVEITVLTATGKELTYPTVGFLTMIVTEDLD